MYDHILFDLDGTLTNPKQGITKSVQHALRAFGIEEPDLDKLEPFIGPPLKDSFAEYYGMNEKECERAILKYREYFQDRGIFENEVLEGIPEMLERLHGQGKTLMVASSKPELFVKRILDKFGLSVWFDGVTGADMDEKGISAKPDVIREALRRLQIGSGDKDKVIMVGDRKHDVEGAQENGIASLGVYVGFAEEGELEAAGADHIAYTVREMSDFLAEH